jgi:prepilin-type processing-associated H-X9-DG protein
MGTRDRKGLVLVELVTLVGVGFVSLGMMLPQIFGAREAARRSQCTNNLKQIGLALHNYHDAIGTFPMSHVLGKTKDDGHGNGQSGFALILPYLEQVAVYNAYNFHLENWHESNATSMTTRIATYVCPSNQVRDPVPATMIKNHHDKAFGGKNKFARGDYGMNWGGVRKASGAEAEKAYGESWKGVMMTVVDPDTKTSQIVRIADILDGTSNTAAVAEKLDSFGWGVGGWGGSEFDVNITPVDPGKGDMERRVFTGSMHPNGMNVLLCDGSVRFITAKTEAAVWRKMTTRAGGEVIGPDDIK